MKTIMITGASGYIGSNLCEMLQQKYNIIQIDTKMNTDINNINLFDYYIDCIVHLAAYPSISDCEQNPHIAIKNNVLNTIKISEYAKKLNIPVIFSSSQAVKNPNSSVYAMTKNICEQIFKQYNKYFILRFSNVYGGKNFINEKSSVIATFLRAYKNNQKIIINGDGLQTRDFIHCNDICKVIIKCIESPYINKILDIGTGKETTILKVANMFKTNTIHNFNSNTIGVKSNFANTNNLFDLFNYIPSDKLFSYIKNNK
jgi:UDP-glucose 4-epimerase